MVTNASRENDRLANQLQDMEVQRVQRPPDGLVHDASRGRRLSLRAVLIHDTHLQAGVRSATRCGVCREGLEGALEKTPQASPRRGGDEVASGSGVDEKSATPPTSANRPGGEENPVLWR